METGHALPAATGGRNLQTSNPLLFVKFEQPGPLAKNPSFRAQGGFRPETSLIGSRDAAFGVEADRTHTALRPESEPLLVAGNRRQAGTPAATRAAESGWGGDNRERRRVSGLSRQQTTRAGRADVQCTHDTFSIFVASSTSLAVIFPPASCVLSRICTRL